MSKPYTIEMEDRGEYLWVLVGGERLTADLSAMYWNRIAERCYELGKLKILIEKDFKESVTPAEMLQMAEHLGKLLPTSKIAFYDRFGHEAINELGKKLARNRDIMMQTFKNPEDAEKWLLAN
jgi:dsDNA-binding SOS-regulon protein